MKKQAFNPYLPLDTYIPDGEPHVFGNRVYIYGSHDAEGGENFCLLDYECWSAPVDDLSDWRCEGTIYRAEQCRHYSTERQDMYAPDVVHGQDGRYYLYYDLSGRGNHGFDGPISVAVCDTPAGKYEYYGDVKYSDGNPLLRFIPFDPAVLNDKGRIYLTYGWGLGIDTHAPLMRWSMPAVMSGIFNKSKEEIKAEEPQSVLGVNLVLHCGNNGEFSICLLRHCCVVISQRCHRIASFFRLALTQKSGAEIHRYFRNAVLVELEDDMHTVKSEPVRILPALNNAPKGSCLRQHSFYEAASLRKFGELYYFIYSSHVNHELCYATSRYPDRGYEYRGVIISNGDIGYNGRKENDRLCATGTNHGSIEYINGKYYIFYHRLTHNTAFSRQGCAEEIEIGEDGTIQQVEMTSCGLNGAPLKTEGIYPAAICCNLTHGHMPHLSNAKKNRYAPNINHDSQNRFVKDIENGTRIGYKYFSFTGITHLSVTTRGACGILRVETKNNREVARIVLTQGNEWTESEAVSFLMEGCLPLYFIYEGRGKVSFLQFCFITQKE